MPKVHLTQQFADNPPVSESTSKIDYFDTQLTGFFLEVRSTGKATFYQRYRDHYSRNRQVRIGPSDAISVDEARQAARKIRSIAAKGFDPNGEAQKHKNAPTFRQFVSEKYIPHVKIYKRSWMRDEAMINKHMMGLWGNAKLSEITPEDIRAFQGRFVSAGHKPATVNRHMALVKYMFSLAEKWEVIDKSPARGMPQLPDNACKERYLTPEETSRLLKALKDCQSRVVSDIIELLILTGARKSEAGYARWEDLDCDRALWTIPLSKSGKRRYIPLSNAALNVLSRQRTNGSAYVFPSPITGKPMVHFHHTWDSIRKKAGIPDVRIHDLRHNFASLLINNGRSLYEVQKLLGHADISTTQRYAHLSQDTLQEATEIVSASIGCDNNTTDQ